MVLSDPKGSKSDLRAFHERPKTLLNGHPRKAVKTGNIETSDRMTSAFYGLNGTKARRNAIGSDWVEKFCVVV